LRFINEDGVPGFPKKIMKFRPSWYTNQMMYAVDIDQPLISVRDVPLHVGLASSSEAVFFFSTRHRSVRLPWNAELNLALFDVDTLAQW
jgi:hypothetical protein